MTKADSVLSTPPTNTSAKQSRRSILGAIAAGSIATLASTIAEPVSTAAAGSPPDPIYAAIELHRDLAKTYDAAWKVRANFNDFGEMTEQEKAQLRQFNDATDAAHLPLEAAALDLFNTEPTTHAGIITALFYMRIQHRNDGEHMIRGSFEDEDGERYIDWRDAWLETLIQAILQLDNAALMTGGLSNG
jgi:hypothetical protein